MSPAQYAKWWYERRAISHVVTLGSVIYVRVTLFQHSVSTWHHRVAVVSTMPPIRRSDSEVTHVSDSEPECEAVRREQQESSPLSSRKSFHYSPRAPLTQISNTPKHARIHRRIATIEKELADIKQEVQAGTSDAGTAPGSLSMCLRQSILA